MEVFQWCSDMVWNWPPGVLVLGTLRNALVQAHVNFYLLGAKNWPVVGSLLWWGWGSLEEVWRMLRPTAACLVFVDVWETLENSTVHAHFSCLCGIAAERGLGQGHNLGGTVFQGSIRVQWRSSDLALDCICHLGGVRTNKGTVAPRVRGELSHLLLSHCSSELVSPVAPSF